MKLSKMPLAFPILLSVLMGCDNQEPRDIGYGYEYLSTNSYNSYIVKDGNIVVYTEIASYKRVEDLIVGNREPSEHPDVSDKYLESGEYGYFVINMLTGELIDGLTEQEAQNIVDSQSGN